MNDENEIQETKESPTEMEMMRNAIKEYQQIVHDEKMKVQALQDEIKSLEAFKKQKADVEALKEKIEKIKKNLLAVETKEKARADAEIEKRMSEVDADIERRVAEKVAEATADAAAACAEAKKVFDTAQERLAEVEAREAEVKERINSGTATVRKNADEEKKSAAARIAAAEKVAAADVLSKPRMEKALFALTGIVNYVDKGSSGVHPKIINETVRQIAGDALEKDKKIVAEAEDAKKAAALLAEEQARLAAEEARLKAEEEARLVAEAAAAEAAFEQVEAGVQEALAPVLGENLSEHLSEDNANLLRDGLAKDLDFGVMERLILQALVGEEMMAEAIREATKDPHTFYARYMFKLGPTDPVTPEQRSTAKNHLFGLMYGGTSCQHVLSTDGLTCEKCGVSAPHPVFDPETHLVSEEVVRAAGSNIGKSMTALAAAAFAAEEVRCVEETGVMRFNPDAVVKAALDPEQEPEESPSEPTGEVPAV